VKELLCHFEFISESLAETLKQVQGNKLDRFLGSSGFWTQFIVIPACRESFCEKKDFGQAEMTEKKEN